MDLLQVPLIASPCRKISKYSITVSSREKLVFTRQNEKLAKKMLKLKTQLFPKAAVGWFLRK